MRAETRDRIRQYLVETILSGDPRGLDDHTDLIATGLLDSFAIIELVRFLEREFDRKLDPSHIDAESLRNVTVIADLVCGSTVGEDEEAV